MKRFLLGFLVVAFLVSGCKGEKKEDTKKEETTEKKEDKKKSEKEEISLENGLDVVISKKELKDSHGDYYAPDGIAILVVHMEVKNTTKKDASFGTSNFTLYINEKKEFSKTFTGSGDGIEFIQTIAAGDTLKGTTMFAAPEKLTSKDKVYINFYDILENPLGKLDLDVDGLTKEVTSVTAAPEEAVTEGDKTVVEMDGYVVKMGQPQIMTGEEGM